MFEWTFSPSGYTFRKNKTMSYILQDRKKTICHYLKWQTVSELTQSHISNLYSKGRLSHYAQWFHHGRDCRLSLKRMLKIFPTYLQSRNDLYSSVLEEWNEHRFFKKESIQQISYGRHYYLDTYRYSDSKCYWKTFLYHLCPY